METLDVEISSKKDSLLVATTHFVSYDFKDKSSNEVFWVGLMVHRLQGVAKENLEIKPHVDGMPSDLITVLDLSDVPTDKQPQLGTRIINLLKGEGFAIDQDTHIKLRNED